MDTSELLQINSQESRPRDWNKQDLGQFVEQMQQWTEMNPVRFYKRPPEDQKRERNYQANNRIVNLKNVFTVTRLIINIQIAIM